MDITNASVYDVRMIHDELLFLRCLLGGMTGSYLDSCGLDDSISDYMYHALCKWEYPDKE